MGKGGGEICAGLTSAQSLCLDGNDHYTPQYALTQLAFLLLPAACSIDLLTCAAFLLASPSPSAVILHPIECNCRPVTHSAAKTMLARCKPCNTVAAIQTYQALRFLKHTCGSSCDTQALSQSSDSSLEVHPFSGFRPSNLSHAHNLLDEIPSPDRSDYSCWIIEYSRSNRNLEALNLFYKMFCSGVNLDESAMPCVLKVCGALNDLVVGRQLHCHCVKSGFSQNISVGNSLINMYMKTGNLNCAKQIFEFMEEKNVVSWNSLLAGYANNGFAEDALDVFSQMQVEGVNPYLSTYTTVFKALADLGMAKKDIQVHTQVIKASTFPKELRFVEQLHSQITKIGFEFNHFIRKALMVAYSRCSRMDDALKMFTTIKESRDVVSWTAMISGYMHSNVKHEAVNLFTEMSRANVRPNDYTFSAILTAHPLVSPVQIHAQLIKTNYEDSPFAANALLDAYIKTGNNQDATKIFERISKKDIVAWSVMLSGCAQTGQIEGAVEIFHRLTKEGFEPNDITFSSILKACASPMASAEQGKQFHASAIKHALNNSLSVSNALVTMYAKRGNIDSADSVFRRQRDLVSWNSIISGFAQHGYGYKALEIFEEMRRRSMEMDSITFIGVITACSHSGLADEGDKFFDLMINDLKINPSVDHYACMVNLYGKTGKLEKAMDLINRMPFSANATIWRTLLAACHVHKNITLGKIAAEKLMILQPEDSAAYALLLNMYAVAGKWKERSVVIKLMKKRKVKKEAGCSWIVVKNKTSSFIAGDRSHLMSKLIYEKIEELSIRLKKVWYEADKNYVLRVVDEESKEEILFEHSERLAVAFGLISTPAGSDLLIEKNLRVCGDCHTVFKLISSIERRKIVVRDTFRFHHFKDGVCSCGDFW